MIINAPIVGSEGENALSGNEKVEKEKSDNKDGVLLSKKLFGVEIFSDNKWYLLYTIYNKLLVCTYAYRKLL